MKKSILFILTISSLILVFIGASKDKTGNHSLLKNTNTGSTTDTVIIGCWKKPLSDTTLYIESVIDSGNHKHFFYIENYVDNTCAFHFNSAKRGIGSINGFNFSFTLFSSDTIVYNGLITDITGTKRMEVYSATDTSEYYSQ